MARNKFMPKFGEHLMSLNRERLDKNEESAEDIKKQLSEAVASEDADKIIELGGQMKSLKGQKEEFINKDEKEACTEDTERTSAKEAEKLETERATKELEEMNQKDKEDSAKKAEEILKKINGESPKETQKEELANEQIDAVALNNKIINMPWNKQQEAIDNLTPEEISAVAKNIAKGDWEHTLDFLNNFKNKPEIIAQPEITEKFKKMLSSGRIHLYDVERIIHLPGTEEIFNDPGVQKGVENSVRSFVVNLNPRERFENVSDALDRVVKGANVSNQGLRSVAEEIKGNHDTFQAFVRHFGTKRIYPEV